MAKPKPLRIPSDDCAVTVNGEACQPHEGEWVEIYSGMSVGEWRAFESIRRAGVDLLAAQGEPDEAARVTAIVEGQFGTLCEHLARRVTAWTWTDDRGMPLPQPDGTPGPLQALRSQELAWLIAVSQGETPAVRKNGSRPSRTTSSDTASPAMAGRKSTGGRSRTKPS
jgi:hypothetical protein